MKKAYEKPLARNLGEILPTAHGYCQKGSVASGLGTNCGSGGAASGGCGNGFNPSGNNSACREGGLASYPIGSNCSAGNNP